MAMQINAGPDAKRRDLWFVDPYQIVVSEELRGRRLPPPDDAIIEMACSMLDQGQLQPVNARRDSKNKLVLTLGFTRTAAARLIRDGFTDPDGNERRDPEFMLQVKVAECNDREAFTRNVVENARRNATSPMDDAHNQERLRGYGMSDTEIGRLYGERNGQKVSRLSKLLRLSDEAQLLVHNGGLSVDAALAVLDLPESDRKKAVAKAAGGKKVTGAEVKRQVREHHLRDEPEDDSDGDGSDEEDTPMQAGTSAKKVPLTVKEVRQFFESLAEATDSVEDATWIPAVQRFAKDTLSWMAGKRSDKAMCKALNRMLAGTPEATTADET